MALKLSKDERAAFLASTTQAEAARIVGRPGKSYRDVTRNVFGTHVSRGGVWDDALKTARLAYDETDDPAERKRIAAEYRATHDAT